MAPRLGVSTYLQTFILISVAIGGSAIVASGVANLPSAAGGPALVISGIQLRQGTENAVLSFAASNDGSGTVTSLTVLNPGVPRTAAFCYTLWNPSSLAEIAGICPTLLTNPASVTIPCSIPPGGSVQVDFTFAGTPYSVGKQYTVIVEAVPAAQGSEETVAVPG